MAELILREAAARPYYADAIKPTCAIFGLLACFVAARLDLIQTCETYLNQHQALVNRLIRTFRVFATVCVTPRADLFCQRPYSYGGSLAMLVAN